MIKNNNNKKQSLKNQKGKKTIFDNHRLKKLLSAKVVRIKNDLLIIENITEDNNKSGENIK